MDPKILLAFIPLFAWTFGDFFIQKTTKKIGSVQSLFFITALTFPFLLPFVYSDLFNLTITQFGSLVSLSILIFVYAILLFQALKVGKLSVLESVIALELPITVGLSVSVLGEQMTLLQILLFFVICFGIFLSTVQKHHKKIFLEKGFYLALASTGLSALTNFYIGVSSQSISPFITIFFTHTFMALLCLIILIYNNEYKTLIPNLRKYPGIIFAQSIFDNIGWIGYAYAVTVLSISLTVTISETYIIFAALLGYYVNKEKLSRNQKIGIMLSLISVILLSMIGK
jgi:drug/metabolite transporter (DMT)-like permease